MPLPILKPSTVLTPDALARQFYQSEINASDSICEPEVLDLGRRYCEPQLAAAPAANRMLDVLISADADAADVVAQIETAYLSRGTRCLEWQINPTVLPRQSERLHQALQTHGYTPITIELLVRRRPVAQSPLYTALQIIPARASYRLAEKLFEQMSSEPAAALRQLDDPRLDALLALRDQKPVGYIDVMAMGQVGRIGGAFVVPEERRRGTGRLLIDRALEICRRSMFHHVFASINPGESSARHLLLSAGFEVAGSAKVFQRTDTPRSGALAPVLRGEE